MTDKYHSSYKIVDFDNYAEYLKSTEGITMIYEYNYSEMFFNVRMSKDNHKIQVKISSEEVLHNHHFMIFKKTAADLKTYITNVKQPQTGNNTISLPKGWLAKELNMTHTEFDMEKINIMKQSARHVLENSLVEGILAGGCFTSWYHQEVPKDFDLFVTDQIHKEIILACSTELNRFKFTDGEYMGNPSIERAILDTQTKIQYVLVKYKTRKEIIDHFDAEHSAVSYDHENDQLYISPSTYECIKNKIIKPHGSNEIQPWRVYKFLKRGFKHEVVSI
jgi:hypothetical protein